jgi:glutamate-1-semialdehyde 2,1-aminomutase
MESALAASGIEGSISRIGSILGLWLQPGPTPRAFHAIDASAAERYAELHPRLLQQGVWMAPSYYEVAFVSTAHRPEHLERARAALERALSELRAQAGSPT